MLHAWRIVKRRYADEAFTGEGARLHGGRWNRPGVPVVYVAESRALAVLETLVGLGSTATLSHYVLTGVRFDAAAVERLDPASLPPGWRRSPPGPETQSMGDRWAREARSPILEVPSAVIPAESNYLLNPHHPDVGTVHVLEPTPFELDARLRGSM